MPRSESIHDPPAGDDAWTVRRHRMVAQIADMARRTAAQTGRAQFSAEVMEAMAAVPRHCFVPAEERDSAYCNRPLAIGHGQTISQPYIVALCTDLVAPHGARRVLDVGTGSGYQAAVLARLADEVHGLEIVDTLAAAAGARLNQLGYRNVHIHHADGHRGWPQAAPFDAIVVAAAALNIPGVLVGQLAPCGSMVAPVGRPHGPQELVWVRKATDGKVTEQAILPVAYVPMTGTP